MSRYIDAEWLIAQLMFVADRPIQSQLYIVRQAPSIDIVFCKDCKHRPIKEDTNGDNYGFNLIEPTEGDERCPCLVEDGWYSWMPNDNFYCGFGEREGE